MNKICSLLLTIMQVAPLSTWPNSALATPHHSALVDSIDAIGSTTFLQPHHGQRALTRFVNSADGTKIHCREAGKGPAILLIPGWMMTTDVWEPQIEYFSKTHRVVSMDPRGQGGSDKPAEGYYPEERARDIKAVVDQLKLAPVVLVAATMAVQEVAAYVDQFGTQSIRGLVFVNGVATGNYDPSMTPALLNYVSALQRDRRAATERFVRNQFRKPQDGSYIQRLISAVLLTRTDSAVAIFLGSLTSDYRAALAKVDCPTLIIVSADLPWQPAYDELHAQVKDSRLERVAGVGHALWLDDVQGFNATLNKFLSGLN